MKKQLLRSLSFLFCLSSTLVSCIGSSEPSNNPSVEPSINTSSEEKYSEKESNKLDPVVTEQETAFDVNDLYKINDGPLPYRLHLPKNYNGGMYHYPVLIFLHGAGERGNNNESQLKNAAQNLFNDLNSPIYQSIAIFPQCPSETNTEDSDLNQWVDTPWSKGNYSVDEVPESNDLKAVLQILNDLKDNYSVNNKRIYVMGLSMGGFGTWDLIMRHTDLFAGAIPICGGADTSYAHKLVDMPIYTIHGTSDDVVPYTGTKSMVEAIKNLGGTSITYEELNGYGHNVWDYASKKVGLMEWLFSKRK